MKKRISFLLGLSLLLIAASSAHAQTWVSGVGDDFNPCSRTAPCKTFAQAIMVTAPGGEISALDPGDFGPVVITKSITINGGSIAGITAPAANGVVVNVTAPGDPGVVVLRGLSINGSGAGLEGIRYVAGAKLVIESCRIYGFTQGIRLMSTTGPGTLAQVTNSLIAWNTGYGVHAEGNGTISVANSLLTNNAVAVQADAVPTALATVRLSNNEIFDNKTDIGCGGGKVVTWKNNKIAGILVPGCAPTDHINEK